jgi:hypothetical protein
MQAEQLLYILRTGILNDRSNNSGGSSDHLWTDDLLIIYMNEAYRRMAVEGLMIRDATTPEVTQFALVAGQRDYALHSSVVAILSARLATSQYDLTRTDHSTLSGAPPTLNERPWDVNTQSTLTPGRPIAYTTDEGMMDTETGSVQQMTFRMLPVPGLEQDGEIIQMRVIRKPLVMFSKAWPKLEPELPEEWQIPMLDWAANLALNIVDDDAGSPVRAADFAAKFEANVTKARNSVLSKLQQGQGWGFGRGGFTWGSGSYGWQ